MTQPVRLSVVAMTLTVVVSLFGPVATGQSPGPSPGSSASVEASLATDCTAVAEFEALAATLVVGLEEPRGWYHNGYPNKRAQKQEVKKGVALLHEFARSVSDLDLPDYASPAVDAVVSGANADAASLAPGDEQMTTRLTDTALADLLATLGAAVECRAPRGSSEPSMEPTASFTAASPEPMSE